MENIKPYIIINCVSYTCITLINAIFNIYSVNHSFNLEIFLITTIISVLMYFTDKIEFKSLVTDNLIRILDIYFAVIVLGGAVFKFYELNLLTLASNTFLIIIVYIAVYAFMMIKDQGYVKQINDKIKRNNKRKN